MWVLEFPGSGGKGTARKSQASLSGLGGRHAEPRAGRKAECWPARTRGCDREPAVRGDPRGPDKPRRDGQWGQARHYARLSEVSSGQTTVPAEENEKHRPTAKRKTQENKDTL